jgi:Sec-independent protein translocase protein TatA
VGISLTEFTVIFLVALVLFGPEQLPVLARTLGKLSGQVKKTSDSLRREFYNSVYPPADLKNPLTGELNALRSLKAELLAPPSGAVGTPSRATHPEEPLGSEQQPPLPPPPKVESA